MPTTGVVVTALMPESVGRPTGCHGFQRRPRVRPQVMQKGMRNRKVGSHELNLESSRSHSLMTVHCESSPTDPGSPDFGHTRHGKITFVDLAGRCASPPESSGACLHA